MKQKILIAALFALIQILNSAELDATLEIIKTTTKTPFILTQTENNSDETKRLNIHLSGDLKVSNHFQAQTGESVKAGVVDFDSLKEQKIDLLARISSSKKGSTLQAKLMLYDTASGSKVLEKEYTEELAKLPFIAHAMAIDINDYIKAPSIDWMKELVVVSKYTKPGNANIVLADYTLTYQQDIITSGLNIFPKWGNREKSIIYFTKYINDKPTIYYFDIFSKQYGALIVGQSMAVVSDVSKDGRKLLLSLANENRAADVYLFNIDTKEIRQLTTFSGIDVGGKFINNDMEVAFISDRLGYPNVFKTNLSGGAVEQMVFHGRNNSSLSSYNKNIVYSSRESNNEFGRNTFNIYLIATDSDFIRRLTEKGSNQMPIFSKDGKNIMFIKTEGNQSALGIIRLDYNASYYFSMPDIKLQAFDW